MRKITVTHTWFALLALALLFAACATTEESRMRKSEQRALLREQMANALATRHFTIDVDRAYPEGPMGMITLTSPYDVTVAGDTLKSHLPFFGRAYQVPYGGGKGLRFEAPIVRYREDHSRRNRQIIYLDVEDTEDSYLYIITLMEDGNATVNVLPRQRSHIEFTGHFKEE